MLFDNRTFGPVSIPKSKRIQANAHVGRAVKLALTDNLDQTEANFALALTRVSYW